MAIGQSESRWWEGVEEEGSMVWGFVGGGWESQGGDSGIVEPACHDLRWYVRRGGGVTSIGLGGADGSILLRLGPMVRLIGLRLD